MKTETFKETVTRLIKTSLENPFIGRPLVFADVLGATDYYRRQIELLGGTDVTVTATLNHDDIVVEARFTPPPEPVTVTLELNKFGVAREFRVPLNLELPARWGGSWCRIQDQASEEQS
jgi:hypothetical protein